MTDQASVSCPKCSQGLRFTPGSSSSVALKCPGCGNFFEHQLPTPPAPTPIKAERIVAEVVEPSPVTQPADEPQAVIFLDDDDVLDAELVDDDLQMPADPQTFPEAAIPTTLRPRLTPQSSAKPKRKTRKPAKPKKAGQANTFRWQLPAAITAGALLVLVTSYGLLSALGFLGGTGSPDAALAQATNLSSLVERYVAILTPVESGESRTKAAKELKELESELHKTTLAILNSPPDERAERTTEISNIMLAGASDRSELLTQSRRINKNYSIEDELREIDFRLQAEIHAAEQHLTYSLASLSTAETDTQRACAASIAIKRRMVATMRGALEGMDQTRISANLQSLADELNQLAESQSTSGKQISVMAFEYEGANHASDAMRRWLADYIKRSASPNHELRLTLDELELVAQRVDLAFRSRISPLTSNTKQRVASKLNTGTRSPNRNFAGDTKPPTQNQANSTDANHIAATSVNPSVSGPPKPRRNFQQTTDLASNDSATGNQDTAIDFEVPILPSANGQSPSGPSPDDQTPGRTNRSPKPLAGKYSGPDSITIKIQGADSLNIHQLAQRLSRSMGSRQVDSIRSNSQAALSFIYSGSMHRVAKMVDFGEVEICDSQSRTLFVVVDPEQQYQH